MPQRRLPQVTPRLSGEREVRVGARAALVHARASPRAAFEAKLYDVRRVGKALDLHVAVADGHAQPLRGGAAEPPERNAERSLLVDRQRAEEIRQHVDARGGGLRVVVGRRRRRRRRRSCSSRRDGRRSMMIRAAVVPSHVRRRSAPRGARARARRASLARDRFCAFLGRRASGIGEGRDRDRRAEARFFADRRSQRRCGLCRGGGRLSPRAPRPRASRGRGHRERRG